MVLSSNGYDNILCVIFVMDIFSKRSNNKSYASSNSPYYHIIICYKLSSIPTTNSNSTIPKVIKEKCY